MAYIDSGFLKFPSIHDGRARQLNKFQQEASIAE